MNFLAETVFLKYYLEDRLIFYLFECQTEKLAKLYEYVVLSSCLVTSDRVQIGCSRKLDVKMRFIQNLWTSFMKRMQIVQWKLFLKPLLHILP